MRKYRRTVANIFFRMVSFVGAHVPLCFCCMHRQQMRRCADTDSFFWLALEICGGVQRRLVPSPQVSELSQRGVHHSTMPPKVAAARRGQGSRVAVGSRHPANKVAAAKNSCHASCPSPRLLWPGAPTLHCSAEAGHPCAFRLLAGRGGLNQNSAALHLGLSPLVLCRYGCVHLHDSNQGQHS